MFPRFAFLLLFAALLCAGVDASKRTRPVGHPAIAFDFMAGSGGGLVINATDGWEFSVESPVTVSSLGVWDHKGDGLGTAIPVGMWDSDGELLASVTIPAGTKAREVDGFRYVAIRTVRLEAGQNYIIGAAYTPETKENIGGGNTAMRFFSDGALRWIGRRRVTRQPALAFPARMPEAAPGVPHIGGFGPNFLIEKATTPRRFYRTYKVEEPRRYVMLDDPESPDDAHRRDPIIHVSLFAKKDGSLTHVLVNGEPFGHESDALTEVNKAIKKLAGEMEQAKGFRPNIRISAPSWVSYTDLLRVVDAGTGWRVTPNVRATGPGRLEFTTLRDTRLPLAGSAIKGRFTDRGEYVEDTWTGLLWQKDGDASGKKTFHGAAEYAAGLKLGEMTGWRVPTIEEVATVFPAVDAPFTDTTYSKTIHKDASYWTSELAAGDDYAYIYIWYGNGGANNCYASRNLAYVRCVRDPRTSTDALPTGAAAPAPATRPVGSSRESVRSAVADQRAQIVDFLRNQVMGRTVVGRVTSSIDRGRLESVFERSTNFTRLIVSENGFGFDEVLRIRETIRPRGATESASVAVRQSDRLVTLRHQYSVRRSTGDVVGYAREMAGSDGTLSAAAVVSRAVAQIQNGELTIRMSTVGYDDHVTVGGFKAGGIQTQSKYSVRHGRLRRAQVNEYFAVDPQTLSRTPDRPEAELIVEDEVP